MKVYLAAASSELERVDRIAAELFAAGVTVVSTWPSVVRAVGGSNPRDATPEQRRAWAYHDLDEIRDAGASGGVIWFLAPTDYEVRQTDWGDGKGGVPPLGTFRVSHPARGAYFELGFAYAWAIGSGVSLIASGDTKQSIFLGLVNEYETDAEALAYVIARARGARR